MTEDELDDTLAKAVAAKAAKTAYDAARLEANGSVTLAASARSDWLRGVECGQEQEALTVLLNAYVNAAVAKEQKGAVLAARTADFTSAQTRLDQAVGAVITSTLTPP